MSRLSQGASHFRQPIHTLHFFQAAWEFSDETEKICATASAVRLGQGSEDSPDQRRRETRCQRHLSAAPEMPRAHTGRGFYPV